MNKAIDFSLVRDIQFKRKAAFVEGQELTRLIAPFFEQRKLAAQKLLKYTDESEESKVLNELIDYLNKEIKTILLIP